MTAAFDWYSATIREYPDVLLEVLTSQYDGDVVMLERPMMGYAAGAKIKASDETVCTVLWGGKNGHPHAFASSDHAPAFASLVRQLWPREHHVTRMDSALDFDAPGVWNMLYPVVRDLALGDVDEAGEYQRYPGEIRRRVMPLVIGQAGDWVRDPSDPLATGRTFYVGSSKSAVRVYLYEKGKEQRSKREASGLPVVGISDDWVRLECRVRPDGDSRHTAATSTPLEAYGYADWSRELLRRVTDSEAVPRVHIKERREPDQERRMHFLMRQYGETLALEAERVGGWEHLGLALKDRYDSHSSAFDDMGNPRRSADDRPF